MPPPPHRDPLDRPALEALYRRLEAPLYNAVYRWLWDGLEARDVVQEAFVRVWDRRDKADASTAEPLLWRTALNLAANRRRTRRLWGWLTLEAVSDRGGREARADEAIDAREREHAVRRAVDALPEKLRRVVLMCEFSELGYAEIARTLGIPEGTVASRRNAAVKKLEESLGALEEAT